LNRIAKLSHQHYAASWPVPSEDTLNDRVTINQLGIRYASMKDGPLKEDLLLEIVRSFDPYLRKFLHMIIRGHVPPMRSPAGKDSVKFLKTLMFKGSEKNPGRLTLLQVCRTLHLAFKQQSTDDIYDSLVLCLIRAVKKYDPYYTDKVKEICGEIHERCGRKRKQGDKPEFSADDIRQQVSFDPTGCLRMLVRRHYLASVAGPKKKVVGYRRAADWPPPPAFFESGPVGFVYFLPLYFRYYLHEYISRSMGDLESTEHVLQLDHRCGSGEFGAGSTKDLVTPHADGNFVDADGSTWAADLTLVGHPLDISQMSLRWVKSTNDKLFRKLTTRERHILYLVYHEEMRWVEVAAVLDCDTTTIRKQYEQVMIYLRGHAQHKKKPSVK
jgi:hypothetical protein